MWFPSGASKTGFFPLHSRPLFPALHWIFPLGLFCKQCVPTEFTIFPPSLSTFLTNDFTSGVSDDQTNPWKAWSLVPACFISSSPCHLWIYIFISTAIIVCRLTIFLLGSLGLFLLTYGRELISWNTILSTFFLQFSSNSLSLVIKFKFFILAFQAFSFSL